MAEKKPYVNNTGVIGELVSGDDLQMQNSIILPEIAAPATPSAGNVKVYAKSDGKVYKKDDTGAESELGGGSAASGGGFFMNYVYDSSTSMTDPGSGEYRLNSGTLSAVTQMTISDIENGGNNVYDWMVFSFTEGASIYFNKSGSQHIYAEYKVSNFVNVGGGYSTVDLQYVSTSGSFTNGDDVVVSLFDRRNTSKIYTSGTITADQNNYDPTYIMSRDVLRLTSDSGMRAITSLKASYNGHIITIMNVGSYGITIPPEHPNGTAANRFSGKETVVILPGCSASFMYDGSISRWRTVNYTPPSNHTFKVVENCDIGGGSVTAGNLPHLGISGNATAQGPSVAIPLPFSSKALHTGTSATGGGAIYFNKTSEEVCYVYLGHLSINALINLRDLSDGTNTYTAYLDALTDPNSTTEAPNNSFGIRYTHGTNSGKWQGYSVNSAGTVSTVDLGVTVAPDTVYSLRIELNRLNTELLFYVDGIMSGTITTNLPANYTTISPRSFIKKSAGTTARYFDIFKMCYRIILP